MFDRRYGKIRLLCNNYRQQYERRSNVYDATMTCFNEVLTVLFITIANKFTMQSRYFPLIFRIDLHPYVPRHSFVRDSTKHEHASIIENAYRRGLHMLTPLPFIVNAYLPSYFCCCC